MTPRGIATYGIVCLLLGWVAAGWLEWSDAPVPICGLVFAILVIIVVAASDVL